MDATEVRSASPPGSPYRFTIDDYLKMAELGVIDPSVRTELVDGQVVVMSPKNAPHVWTKNRLRRAVERLLANDGRWEVIDQDSIRVPDGNLPEPDIAVVPPLRPDVLPLAAEALLVVEISDTTLADDLGRKRVLYAVAGVPHYWVVDLNARVLHRFAEPRTGDYAVHEMIVPPASVAVPGVPAPAGLLPIDQFFAPRS